MMSTMYIGTYTHTGSKGIYRVELCGGKLCMKDAVACENPSCLLLDQAHSKLIAVVENAAYRSMHGGGVEFFDCTGTGFPLAGWAATEGAAPCHLSLSPHGKQLYVANYMEGTITCIGLDCRGLPNGQKNIIVHEGSSIHPRRQEKPHVHHATLTPDQHDLAVCDLGMDQVLFYPLDENELPTQPYAVKVPAGTGPRHTVFLDRDELWYLVSELSNEVYVYKGYGSKATLLQTCSTLADPDVSSGCAAIRLSPDQQYLIASNRGEDSIALFAIEASGLLRHIESISIGGCCPHDAAFSPEGDYLVEPTSKAISWCCFPLQTDA